MFEEMGFRDAAVLDGVEAVSREYFTEALRAGTYLGWIAENSDSQVIGGGGIVVPTGPAIPERIIRREYGFLTCIRSRERGVMEWPGD